jgi:hypothetical protein
MSDPALLAEELALERLMTVLAWEQHVRADGIPKTSLTFQAARAEAAKHPGKRAYRCSYCDAYHIGGVREWEHER